MSEGDVDAGAQEDEGRIDVFGVEGNLTVGQTFVSTGVGAPSLLRFDVEADATQIFLEMRREAVQGVVHLDLWREYCSKGSWEDGLVCVGVFWATGEAEDRYRAWGSQVPVQEESLEILLDLDDVDLPECGGSSDLCHYHEWRAMIFPEYAIDLRYELRVSVAYGMEFADDYSAFDGEGV